MEGERLAAPVVDFFDDAVKVDVPLLFLGHARLKSRNSPWCRTNRNRPINTPAPGIPFSGPRNISQALARAPLRAVPPAPFSALSAAPQGSWQVPLRVLW